MSEHPNDEARDDYASLADEMNDGDVEWKESDWEPRAVENAKRYAKAFGLSWPPRPGDFDRFYERTTTGEHTSVSDCSLVFLGHVAAPGYGVSFECSECGRPWLKLGASYVDPRERVYELSPEDVR